MRRPLILALLAQLAAPVASHAGVVAYDLDPAASTVAFETDFGPDRITGAIPLERPISGSISTLSRTARSW
jgi:hypothetical protein